MIQYKTTLFNEIEAELRAKGFRIVTRDESRPWGGFFVLDECQAQAFADAYFEGIPIDRLKISGKLSPKILLVAPGKRLSWQYHLRRAEVWKVQRGPVGIVTSETDAEHELKVLAEGTLVTLKQGERHRLIGLTNWGVLSEIWQHTDPEWPSDEEDIIRVQDDFGRDQV